jgi:hypothetical protein
LLHVSELICKRDSSPWVCHYRKNEKCPCEDFSDHFSVTPKFSFIGSAIYRLTNRRGSFDLRQQRHVLTDGGYVSLGYIKT